MQFKWDRPYPVTFYHGDEITEMFIAPGDSIRLTLDTKQFDETVAYQGKGADVNNYLAKKALRFSQMDSETYNMLEQDFVMYEDSVTNAGFNLFMEHFSRPPLNDKSFKAFKDYELAEIYYEHVNNKVLYPALHLYLNPTSGQKAVFENYYGFLATVPVYDQSAIHSGAYQQFLSGHVDKELSGLFMMDTTQSMVDLKTAFIETTLTGEIKDYIYAAWIYDLLTNQGDLPNSTLILEKFRQAAPGNQYLPMLDETLILMNSLSPGSPAPDFTCRDINGKEVSLVDFKGKIVYMDIWATWCGPCRGEIPYAEKLGEEMRDEDVVFLCVSIDADEDAWKKFVKKKEMHGVHVISKGEFDSPIATLYGVTGIPNYVLIDREGKIVNSNASRPSMGAKEEIEALLD
jgi:peroxiredoxin